jgi:hypothetical protein
VATGQSAEKGITEFILCYTKLGQRYLDDSDILEERLMPLAELFLLEKVL